ncbi:MAG: DNA helicase RecQ [Pseudomonadales bacterium]|nr:DNA helicase RecQ [Pseudomonadales bacterium]
MPLSILRNVFGYEQFRGQQAEIIEAICANEDVLVLMPTGGGKSLCYQIPALIRNGMGVVISPLIALMQDQVSALAQVGIKAEFLNSSLSAQQAQEIEENVRRGEVDLLYIAPERLMQRGTFALIQSLVDTQSIALFAIDEAHCVSQWGHDFRSEYLKLSILHEQFPSVPRIALTATADARTQQEIIERLQLEHARHFISGFDRPNIQYRVHVKDNPKQQLLAFLQAEHEQDSGIIYCLSRKSVESTAEWLQIRGFDALPYHAGLPAEMRREHQARFLREDKIIMVATIAFGMGIDKPDVRFVAHMDLPKSLESYYQETGRAGRDGEAANAWMVYGLQDAIKLKQMMAQGDGNEDFKRAEVQKLDALLGFCEVTTCRRNVLLNYFGEIHSKPCENCDTCLRPPETWDATVAAQKALSTVHHSGQRFGVAHLVAILLGADNQRIRQFNHDKLSTYGIGKELDAVQWRSVFRQLVAMNYIAVDISGYGALSLQETCRPLLKGLATLMLRVDPQVSAAVSGRARGAANIAKRIEEEDVPLWMALRKCRKQLAEDLGVPPYVVFHDATLLDMIAKRPSNKMALLAINGVGESKMEKYGQEFLTVIETAG